MTQGVAQLLSISLMLGALCACGKIESHSELSFTSYKATLLNFTFDGELIANSELSPEAAIQKQLNYTIGQLNGKDSVGRLDAVLLTVMSRDNLSPGLQKIRYHAVLPVGWSAKYNLPKTYDLVLPLDLTVRGQFNFTSKYKDTCVDLWSAHDLAVDNMWYYYRPFERKCQMDAQDLFRTTAIVSEAAENRDGTYPELDKIWVDAALKVVVIFGKDTAGSTSPTDFGISQYCLFNANMPYSMGLKLTPNPIPKIACPGVENPDLTWTGVFPDGRRVSITTLLVDNPRLPNPIFDKRYAEVSIDADIIIYNGHAALGNNVRALTRKGHFVPGQYTILSMMSCDSFAYVDGFMGKEKTRLNPDDPNGTKYLDIITNITPANPTWLRQAAVALITGVMDQKRPRSYQQILRGFETAHRAVVTGDEDNAYQPVPVQP